MKKINYHTHTYRCGHAEGTEEDMVKAAIKCGIEDLGFSCHTPFPQYRKHLIKALPAIRSVRSLASWIRAFINNGPNMRMPYNQLENYLDKITKCKNIYKQINIYKGLEAEGLSDYFDYYQQLLDDGKIDYLILGHHFHKYCIHNDYYGRENLTKKDIYQYCNDVEKAIDTQLFSYIAHPDLFLMGYHNFGIDMQTVSRRICEKAKQNNIPLELNAGGIRKGLKTIQGEKLYFYPNDYFWEIAAEIGNDVIIGFDAHNPTDFNEGMYQTLLEYAHKHQLHIIDEFPFLKGKNH